MFVTCKASFLVALGLGHEFGLNGIKYVILGLFISMVMLFASVDPCIRCGPFLDDHNRQIHG